MTLGEYENPIRMQIWNCSESEINLRRVQITTTTSINMSWKPKNRPRGRPRKDYNSPWMDELLLLLFTTQNS